MRLEELLASLPEKVTKGRLDSEVAGIAFDSRRVRSGEIFVAIKGLQTDGHHYIPSAIAKGAVAVVVESSQACAGLTADFPCILVPDSREALAYLAAAFHGFPGRALKVIGVTGTDGKTSTVKLIGAILTAEGYKTGLVNTLSAVIAGETFDTGLHTTTPDALTVQKYLTQMVAAGSDYAILEATSHGLYQHRVTACEFDMAVLTNITHEHLDYHRTYQEYREAKARLFRSLAISYRKPATPKVAILNADDPSFAYLRKIPVDSQVTYGLEGAAQVSAERIEASLKELRFCAKTPLGDFEVKSPLFGRFHTYNILAAIAVGLSQGISIEAMQRGVKAVEGVTGRMERIEMAQEFTVLIDFAHTPNALEKALQSARQLSQGRVIVAFGCPGLRDRAKRPMMGEIAGRLADRVVITADDPRTEDLNQIMAQIALGCEKVGCREGKNFWRIGDRGEAIEFAVELAEPGDLVLLAGKGHERSMALGQRECPWSDHEAAQEAIAHRQGRP